MFKDNVSDIARRLSAWNMEFLKEKMRKINTDVFFSNRYMLSSSKFIHDNFDI